MLIRMKFFFSAIMLMYMSIYYLWTRYNLCPKKNNYIHRSLFHHSMFFCLIHFIHTHDSMILSIFKKKKNFFCHFTHITYSHSFIIILFFFQLHNIMYLTVYLTFLFCFSSQIIVLKYYDCDELYQKGMLISISLFIKHINRE